MIRLSQEEIEQILEEHKKWLAGNGGSRADLSEVCLREADLSGADLSGADLCRADLSGADLRDADLRGSDLNGADLSESDLRGADLREANLRGADLTDAKLDGAKLNVKEAEGVKGIDLEVIREVSKHRLVRHEDVVYIGCKKHSLDYWLENYVYLGKENGYSAEEIEEYGSILKSMKQ